MQYLMLQMVSNARCDDNDSHSVRYRLPALLCCRRSTGPCAASCPAFPLQAASQQGARLAAHDYVPRQIHTRHMTVAQHALQAACWGLSPHF